MVRVTSTRATPGSGDTRGNGRPAWQAAVSFVVPILVPILLLGVGLFYFIGRDAEPGGLGEPETGLVPGAVTVTGWHRADTSLVPVGFGLGDPGHATPAALVDTMVAEARQAADGEAWIAGSIISEDADAATVRVYLPLPQDSATIAAEHLLELAPKADGWYVANGHVRFHCRRAVRDSFCG